MPASQTIAAAAAKTRNKTGSDSCSNIIAPIVEQDASGGAIPKAARLDKPQKDTASVKTCAFRLVQQMRDESGELMMRIVLAAQSSNTTAKILLGHHS